MKEAAAIFLFVSLVATIGIIQQISESEKYNFPTANMLRRCIIDDECGAKGWCQNVAGGDGGTDGRRGKRCSAKYPLGVTCFEHKHCRSGYCNYTEKRCVNPPETQ